MPKKLIKRFLPDHEKIRQHQSLTVFGEHLHDPNLWHLNRRSAAGAFAVGLFVAFVPLPFQMAIAAAVAIAVRVNLAVSVVLVWVTNPVTIPPIFYSAYRTGVWLLGTEPQKVHFELSVGWAMNELSIIWQPLLLGCFVLGTLSALTGYAAIRGLWRLRLVRHARRRRGKREGKDR